MLKIERNSTGPVAVITAPGVKVAQPLRDAPERDMERTTKATGPSPFGSIASSGLGLPEGMDWQLGQIVANDTQLERKALAATYSAWMKGILADVAPGVQAALAVARNRDLKDSVREARTLEKLAPALEKLPFAIEKGLAPLLEQAEQLTGLAVAALLPEPIEGHGLMVRELRAGEIRRRALEMPENERPRFALALAGRGLVDALHALDDDPGGVGLVAEEPMRRAREVLMRKIGGAGFLEAWRDSIRFAEVAAAYGDAIAGQIMSAMPIPKREKAPTDLLASVKTIVAGHADRARLNPWN